MLALVCGALVCSEALATERVVPGPNGERPRLLDTRDGAPLSDFQWKYRLLILFAEDEKAIAKQIARLPTEGLIDRDVLVIRMFGREHGLTVAPDGRRPPWTAIVDLNDTPFENARGEGLFAPDFLAILVGKDGGEKKRWTEDVDPQELFLLIDAMPMRRREAAD